MSVLYNNAPYTESAQVAKSERHSPSGFESRSSGKERDSETGLDYFGARYYGSTMGRWLSPDWSGAPEPVPYADFSDPQTLNLYGYVRNNSLSHADADGHCCDLNDVVQTVGGAVNAFNEANGFSFLPKLPENDTGRAIGNTVAAVQGGLEVIGGATMTAGGATEALVTSPAAGTGAGAVIPLAGVATAVGGLVVSAHGSVVLGNALNQMSSTHDNTAANQERMSQGKAPIGKDGKPVELHHEGQSANGQLKEMTQTEHRGGGNFKKNHRNTGQQPSQLDRNKFKQDRQKYWKDKTKE